jgi:antitoxin ParD1/3/4
MDSAPLPPELEAYANEALASGRYPSREALLAAGVRLLKEADAEVTDFVRSLEDARSEAGREGWYSLDEVMAEADEIIAGKRNAA